MESMAADKLSSILSADALVAAFKAQSEMFERFISMARSPDEPAVINVMLQKTIDISIIFFPARRVSGDFYDAFMLPNI